MNPILDHHRSEHLASCPCNLCIAYDIAYAKQEGLRTEHYKENGLEFLLKLYRNRKLNWDLPEGHCLLCGGVSMYAHAIAEHHFIRRFNVKHTESLSLCSTLLHKEGSRAGIVKVLSHDPKKLKVWTANMQELLPEKCLGLNCRDIGDWFEIRLAYSEMVEDPLERRIERRWAGEGEGSRTRTSPR